MQDKGVFYLGLLSLLAFAPIVFGGRPLWAAHAVTAGMLGLLALEWDHQVFSSHDMAWLVAGIGVALRLIGSPPEAVDGCLILLGCSACFILSRTVAAAGRGVKLVVRLCWVGAAFSLIGILQAVDLLPHGWWDPVQFNASTFINHNHFAAYLNLLLPLGLALQLSSGSLGPQRPGFSLGFSILLMGVAWVLTCSRGGWMSLLLSLMGAGALFLRRRWGRPWDWRAAWILAPLLAVVVFGATQPAVLKRLATFLNVPGDASVQVRWQIFHGAWDLIRDHPFWGGGLESFLYLYPRHRPPGLYRLVNYAHQEYLQLTAEMGWVGLVLLACVAIPILIRVIRLIRGARTPWKRNLGVGGLVAFGTMAIHGLVDFPWHIPAVLMTFAAVMGLVSGVPYRQDPLPLRRIGQGRAGLRFILASAVIGTLVWSVMADGWAYAGRLFENTGSAERAAVSYRRAAAMAPWRSAYDRQIGALLHRRAQREEVRLRDGTLREGAEAYRKALALVPYDSVSAHALGEILRSIGQVEEADRWLTRAVSQDPNNPLYCKDWGELKLMRGEEADAAKAFRRVGELTRPYGFYLPVFGVFGDAAILTRRGRSALRLGGTVSAMHYFSLADQIEPGYPEAKVGLALCRFAEGRREAAEQIMVSVKDPILKAEWFAGLAHLSFRQGKRAEAQVSIEESLRRDPSNVQALQLQLLLQRNPAHPAHAAALQKLLSLNRTPVWAGPDEKGQTVVVWEPGKGSYLEGRRTKGGWALNQNGSIQQRLFLPPGKVHMRMTAWGTQAAGTGSRVEVYWADREVFTGEIQSHSWEEYPFALEVLPGETDLEIRFTNDLFLPKTREDRNLRIKSVVAQREGA